MFRLIIWATVIRGRTASQDKKHCIPVGRKTLTRLGFQINITYSEVVNVHQLKHLTPCVP